MHGCFEGQMSIDVFDQNAGLGHQQTPSVERKCTGRLEKAREGLHASELSLYRRMPLAQNLVTRGLLFFRHVSHSFV
jgi:hypothetical protein